MHLQFDASQDHQLDAISAIADLFEGLPYNKVGIEVLGSSAVVGNQLALTNADLIRNLQGVQESNRLPLDSELHTIDGQIETDRGMVEAKCPNFSVEMETGTGKTYVYIRTALELARRYGMSKFIIVVPSVAVREGVLKTFRMTQDHFRVMYSGMPYRYAMYDSGALSRIRTFAESNVIEFLIMTIDSFNKDANIIRQTGRDQSYGIPPIRMIQNTRPILILDEPQNFKTERAEAALTSLYPLFALRYSATHPKGKEFNRVYRLSPAEAYRRGLVKKIEVWGTEQRGASDVFIQVEGITAKKTILTVRLTVQVLEKSGQVKQKTIAFKPDGQPLSAKTNLPEHDSYIIEELRTDDQSVTFTNGIVLRKGDTKGVDKEAIFDAQIRSTIRQHIRKQKQLQDRGIKVLSLFFIDRVENYAGADGLIRRLFNQAFNELKQEYDTWGDLSPESVQGAYFSGKRNRSGEIVFEDTRGEGDKDKDAYDLIMRDKETLLTLSSPSDDEETRRKRQICFIFSHSALREGWDNPNVFQICTLNQSVSEMRKRQEIGRGVRLAVNQAGERVHDEAVNVLTVIPNESYQNYVNTLQREVTQEYDAQSAAPVPSNARQRGVAKLRKQYQLKPEFLQLWERIKHKTYYNVQIDTEALVTNAVEALNQAVINPPQIVISRGRVEVSDEDDTFVAKQTTIEKVVSTVASQRSNADYADIIGTISHMLQYSTPPLRLTRRTLHRIVTGTNKSPLAHSNPNEFAAETVRILRERLAEMLVHGIEYERNGDWYEMTQFQPEIPSWEEYLIKVQGEDREDDPKGKSLYSHVIFDSEVERQFVLDLERWDEVKLYVKLPSWFTVPTPVGTYNPDWAIVIEPHKETGETIAKEFVYLVSETKSTTNVDELRPNERRKIICGQKHFQGALKVMYKHITSVDELQKALGRASTER